MALQLVQYYLSGRYYILDKEKVILCNVALFNMRATVFYPDNTTDAVAVTDLIKYIPSVCHNDGIYKVHMFGNKEYIDGLINQMIAEEALNYSAGHRIVYEVN